MHHAWTSHHRRIPLWFEVVQPKTVDLRYRVAAHAGTLRHGLVAPPGHQRAVHEDPVARARSLLVVHACPFVLSNMRCRVAHRDAVPGTVSAVSPDPTGHHPRTGTQPGQGGAAPDAERLLAWFARHERDLPWRSDRTPYRVWVSEVMLQQTRADTVVPYFQRFMSRFPDVETLAAAHRDDVLKAWEGLGYYRRARSLHQAAGQVVNRFDGQLPGTVAELQELPGFGPYTAAAVAALAFGRPAIAVDANVRRVGARYLGQSVADDVAIVRGLEPWLAGIEAPERVTEALIELGALVCSPRRPACGKCPLRRECRAAATGAPEMYPQPVARRTIPTRRRYAQVCTDPAGAWLEQRPMDGLLGGLWGFPQHETRLTGSELGTIHHAYTHFRLELVLMAVTADPSTLHALRGEHIPWSRVGALPLAGVDKKVLEHLTAMGMIDAV